VISSQFLSFLLPSYFSTLKLDHLSHVFFAQRVFLSRQWLLDQSSHNKTFSQLVFFRLRAVIISGTPIIISALISGSTFLTV